MKLFLTLLIPFFINATILEEITDEIGISAMSENMQSQKQQSDKNSKKIDELSDRLLLLDAKMQKILDIINTKQEMQNKTIVTEIKTSKKKTIDSKEVIYTLQMYSSYNKKSALRYFNKLPKFIQTKTKLYKIGQYFVLRFGGEKIRKNLAPIKKRIKELGYKDIFSVKTSLQRFNEALTP